MNAARQGAADVDITHVLVKVKPGSEQARCCPWPGCIDQLDFAKFQAFKKATRVNAMESAQSPARRV